jgi:hypothetical protein
MYCITITIMSQRYVRALLYGQKGGMRKRHSRARICKPFKEPMNRFQAWRAGETILFDVPARHAGYIGRRNGFLKIDSRSSPLKRLQIRALTTVTAYG